MHEAVALRGAVVVRRHLAAQDVAEGGEGVVQRLVVDRFVEVLDELALGGSGDTWNHRLIATIACHASVRAGQVLSIDDCKNLVRQLEEAVRPNTCPHGRPTIVRLRVNDLEREFKRR